MIVVFQCKHTGRAHLGKLLDHRVAGGGEPLREILAGQFIVQVTPTCTNMVGTFATVVGDNKFTWTLWEGGGVWEWRGGVWVEKTVGDSINKQTVSDSNLSQHASNILNSIASLALVKCLTSPV